MCEISATGVIFLNRVRRFSMQAGMYLSNSITKLVFSDCCSLVSNQLVTYLKIFWRELIFAIGGRIWSNRYFCNLLARFHQFLIFTNFQRNKGFAYIYIYIYTLRYI